MSQRDDYAVTANIRYGHARNALFLHVGKLFSSGRRGAFLALSAAAGRARGPRALTAQVWAPAGLRGACSGRSKSHELAAQANLTKIHTSTYHRARKGEGRIALHIYA